MYTADDIYAARSLAEAAGLRGLDDFLSVPVEDAVWMCNGIGPAWLPDCCVRILNARFRELSVPAMVHDVQFSLGDGTSGKFHEANANFRWNGIRLARLHHAWWSPARYLVAHDAVKLAAACETLGWPAYRAAIRDYANRKAGQG